MTSSSAPPKARGAEDARPRLIVFCSAASGRCRRFEGFLAHVIQRGGNHETFRLHRVDPGRRPDLAERFGVETLPTLLVVEARRIRARLEGAHGCQEIEDVLAPWLQRLTVETGRRRPAKVSPPDGWKRSEPGQSKPWR